MQISFPNHQGTVLLERISFSIHSVRLDLSDLLHRKMFRHRYFYSRIQDFSTDRGVECKKTSSSLHVILLQIIADISGGPENENDRAFDRFHHLHKTPTAITTVGSDSDNDKEIEIRRLADHEDSLDDSVLLIPPELPCGEASVPTRGA